jgi:hypothetical protein
MRYSTPNARSGTVRARRIISPILTMILLAVSILYSPSDVRGAMITGPASVSAPFGDDIHTSTLNPYPMTPVSTITYAGNPALNGQCSWINTALDKYIAANPGWTYSWAGVAQEAKVEAGISLVSYTFNGNTYDGYNPYVVSQPDVKAANGTNYPSDISNAEVGGAVLNLKYKPQQGAPAITNLHWIQAYTGTIYGNAFGPFLDNDPTQPYKGQNNAGLPFYDGTYTAGTLDGGGGWFLDTPFVTEQEYESNPVVNAQFQVVLADYDATNKKLTLYGGEWWGFNYSAVDTPEPATCLLMTIGGGGLLFFRRMTGRRSAA